MQEPRRRPTKRKHSPSAPNPPRVPYQQFNDPSDVSNPPVLVPHSLSLPDSPFTFYSTRSHPYNKHSYRYTACGPSLGTPLPVPPQRAIQSFPPKVRWSWEDRSPFTLMTEDAETVTTDKGWRAVRSNIGLREGAWYWEVKVERGGGDGGREQGGNEAQGSWVRVGVGRRESPLNAPVGMDGCVSTPFLPFRSTFPSYPSNPRSHSYGYRDKSGDVVTLAQPKPYGIPYGSSVTIGIYLSLPPRPASSSSSTSDRRDPARIQRKRIPIRYKGQLYFEQLEYPASKEMDELLVDPALKAFRERQAEEKKAKEKAAAPGTKAAAPTQQGPPLRPLPKLEGSKIAFFVDGVCQGVAFEDLYDFLPLRKDRSDKQQQKKKETRLVLENSHDDGTLGYFPMASVFHGGIATINAGPHFAFPPPVDIEAALRESPHPPSSTSSSSSTAGGEAAGWRPLCDRYDEHTAEQARLDDLDEQEAIRALFEAQRVAAEQEGSIEAAAPASKKAKTSLVAAAVAASSKLANSGVVVAGSAAGAFSESPVSSPFPLPEGSTE